MKKAVNVIVYDNENKILILKRSPDETHFQNFWDSPGGAVEDNESPREAAEREVKEECGLNVKMDDVHFFVFCYDSFIPDEVFGFKAKLIDGNVMLSEEHTEYRWVSKKNYNAFKYSPSVVATIKKFFK